MARRPGRDEDPLAGADWQTVPAGQAPVSGGRRDQAVTFAR